MMLRFLKCSDAFQMRKLLISVALIASVALGGCVVHKIDVQQGNLVDQEAVDQLKPGMTRRQVEFLLGTPLIKDPFHAGRWDYVYSMKPGRGERTLRRLTVFFDGDALSRIEGDYRPNPDAAAVPAEPPVAVTVPAQDRDRSMWQRVKGWFSF